MRNGKRKREIDETNQALERGAFTRLGYTFLIEELIKQHPDARGAFNNAIKDHPSFKQIITDLADLLELNLSEDG